MTPGYSNRVFFLLLVLSVVAELNAVFARRQSSEGFSVLDVLSNIPSYDPISGLLEGGAITNTPGGPEIWRLSFPLKKSIIDEKPLHFTVGLEIPPKAGTRIQRFVVHPRKFCVAPEGWYAYKKEDYGSQQVVALMKLVTECDHTTSQNVIFDIECDACDVAQAKLTYKAKNVKLRYLQKWQLYDSFWSRNSQSATFVSARQQNHTPAASRRWRLTTEARNLCLGLFEGGIAFNLENPVKPHFRWSVSGSKQKYEALVGAQGTHFVVTWHPKDKWSLCNDLSASISLFVQCKSCILDQSNVMAYLLTKPNVPQEASSSSIYVSGWWQDTGICTVAAGGFAKPEKDDQLRLWFTPDVPGDNVPDDSETAFCPPTLFEKMKVVSGWEDELSMSLNSLARSFFNIPKCLCQGLKGRIYKPVEWRPKSSDADYEKSTFENRYYEPVIPYSRESYRSFVANSQHITARRSTVYSQQWYLVANISEPQLRCAKQELTVNFRIHSNTPIQKAVPADHNVGRFVLHYHAWDQGVDVTLTPLSVRQTRCTPEIHEALSILVYCARCTTVEATVKFIPGPALEDIRPQVPHLRKVRTASDDSFEVWSLASSVDPAIVARGGATPFIAVIDIPPLSGRSIDNFAVRPRTLLTEKNIWYDYKEKEVLKVVIALRYPETWDDTEPKLGVDIECSGCDFNRVRMTHKYADAQFEEVEARYNLLKFVKRRPESSVLVSGTRKEPCQAGMYCHEFKLTADQICGFPFDGVLDFTIPTPVQKKNFYWQVSDSDRFDAEIGGISQEGRGFISWKPSDSEKICSDLKATISLHMMCKDCYYNYVFQVNFPREHEVPQGASSKIVSELVPFWDIRDDSCSFRVQKGTPALVAGDIPKIWWTPTTDCDVPFFSGQAQSLVRDTLNRFWNQRRLVRYWEAKIAESPKPNLSQRFYQLPRCVCDNAKGRVYRLVDASSTVS